PASPPSARPASIGRRQTVSVPEPQGSGLRSVRTRPDGTRSAFAVFESTIDRSAMLAIVAFLAAPSWTVPRLIGPHVAVAADSRTANVSAWPWPVECKGSLRARRLGGRSERGRRHGAFRPLFRVTRAVANAMTMRKAPTIGFRWTEA